MVADVRTIFEQPIGAHFSRAFRQPVSGCRVHVHHFDQYLSICPQRRLLFEQPIEEAVRCRKIFPQPIALLSAHRRVFHQPVTIAGDPVRAVFAQPIDILARTPLRMAFDQPISLEASAPLFQSGGAQVAVDGYRVRKLQTLFLAQEETVFHCSGELQILSADEALRFLPGKSRVEVVLRDGTTFVMVPEPMRYSAENGQETWTVPLVSPVRALDFPEAAGLAAPVEGALASVFTRKLAQPYDLEWQLPERYFSADQLKFIEGQSPIEALRLLAAAPFGVLQTTPAGTLVARPVYPVAIPELDTATPAGTLIAAGDFFTVGVEADDRDGYNVFRYGDSSRGTTAAIQIESQTLSATRARIKVWTEEERSCALRHSGGDWVGVIAEGITEETITEQVEIIAGSGRLRYPATVVTSSVYQRADLGAITFSGADVKTEKVENTLISVEYLTRYYSFLVSDPYPEAVQFFPDCDLDVAAAPPAKAIELSRPPADKPAPVITDPLLAGAPAAIHARLVGELDRSCSHRQSVAVSCPDIGFVATGSLWEVVTESGTWRGIVRFWSYTETLQDHNYTITVDLNLEREAR